MPQRVPSSELEAYLDEALPADDMARIEKALRQDPALARQLAAVLGRRDAGVHSLGEIWRRHRISCPTREQLGSYLLGALGDEAAGHVRFHLETVGCRYCLANLADLERQQAEAAAAVQTRRRKYFQSSVGRLGPRGS
jgi:anti-sigma factor RsiW